MRTASLTVLSLVGCVGSEVVGDRLVASREMFLAEPDSLLIAMPGYLTVGEDGTLYLSDGMNHRVVAYSAAGSPVAVYGHVGRGPGEFTGAGLVFVAGNSVFAVDHGNRRVHVFDRHTGRVLGTHAVPSHQLYSFAVEGSVVWLGLIGALDEKDFRAVLRWDLHTDSMRAVLATPPEYYAFEPSPLVIFSSAYIDKWRDTLAVAFGARNALELYGDSGEPLGSFELPVTRRRGVPPERKRVLTNPGPKEMKTLTYEAIQGSFSSPRLVRRLSNGEVAVVHADQTANGTLITARVFVSILSLADRTACVDREVEVAQEGRPALAIAGDSLFVVDQVLDDVTGARIRLRVFPLERTGCARVPVGEAVALTQ